MTWSGPIAKLVEFVVGPLVRHTVEGAFDKRRRVANLLLQLHAALEGIELAIDHFRIMLEPVVAGQKIRIYDVWLRGFNSPVPSADKASQAFIDAMQELLLVVRIVDPSLAALLSSVSHGKKGLQTFMSLSGAFHNLQIRLVWRQSGSHQTLAGIEFFSVEGGIDAPALYQTARKLRARGEPLHLATTEWPKDCILQWLEASSTRVVAEPTDIAAIKMLDSLLEVQRMLVYEARIGIQALIVKSFKVEDLLGIQVE